MSPFLISGKENRAKKSMKKVKSAAKHEEGIVYFSPKASKTKEDNLEATEEEMIRCPNCDKMEAKGRGRFNTFTCVKMKLCTVVAIVEGVAKKRRRLAEELDSVANHANADEGEGKGYEDVRCMKRRRFQEKCA